MALKPEAFQKCFQDWITHAIQADDSVPNRLIAIDGTEHRITATLIIWKKAISLAGDSGVSFELLI
jgi:hypothetical protein